MAILDIIKEPDSRLHKISRTVKEDEFRGELGQELKKRLSDMADTMYASGGVGLAGPQVGDFRRILVADLGYAQKVSENKIAGQYGTRLIKMINPEIIEKSGSVQGPEGCLSIPGFQQTVERSSEVTIQYLDDSGKAIEKTFKNFIAVIIQHELDHLDGVTLLDEASSFKRSRYLKKIRNK